MDWKWKIIVRISETFQHIFLNFAYLRFFSIEMNVLQVVQKNFAFLGINPHRPLNANLFIVIIIITWSHTSNCVYLSHVASTFQEFTLSINSTSTTTVIILVYGLLVWKMRALLDFISCLELVCE